MKKSKILKKLEMIPMTNVDIKKYYPKAPIYTYDQFSKLEDLNDLFNRTNYVFVLYLVGDDKEDKYGHWCLILKYNNTLFEFFSSYGDKYDSQLKYNNKQQNKNLDQQPYITNLLKKTNAKMLYNKVKYQSDSKDVSTCGRHCVFRLRTFLNNNFDDKKYKKFMSCMKNILHLNYDKIVSILVSSVDEELFKNNLLS